MTQTAGWLRDQVKKVVAKFKVRPSQFWSEDGNSLLRVLRDIHENKDDYPDGYRNLLYMTNFSRTENDQVLVVTKVLSLIGENKELAEGLICMEYTHKHVRLAWRVDKSTDGSPFVDGDLMLGCAKSLREEYKDDPVGFAFFDGVALCEANEGEIQTLESKVSNINFGYSLLVKYKTKMMERDLSRKFFLKVMVVAGEIGARGVRYKAKTHQLVLTDMFHAYAVSNTQQVTAHGTGVVQAIGRLCTMTTDPSACPPIKLWTPEDCATMDKAFMEVFDCVNELNAYKQAHNILTWEELLQRVTRTRPPPFPHLQRLLTTPTGYNKKGDAFYGRPSHLLGSCKKLSNHLARHHDCVPVDPFLLPPCPAFS